MKRFIESVALLYMLIAIYMIISICRCSSIKAKQGQPASLPCGYSIQVNNVGKYRWVDNDGFVSSFRENTKEDAINMAVAWSEYNEYKKTAVWTTIEPVTSSDIEK